VVGIALLATVPPGRAADQGGLPTADLPTADLPRLNSDKPRLDLPKSRG
jgi:hypothetical protein